MELIRAYERSIINIHPSLLPAFGGKGFYGMNVHKAVIASGARYTSVRVSIISKFVSVKHCCNWLCIVFFVC